MESRLTSSGECFQEPQHRTFSTKFSKIWKENASHLKISLIESTSWTCSTTLIWIRKEMGILALPLRGESKNTPQDSMTDTGHSGDPEKKASGVKDMQSIVEANGIFVLYRCWRNANSEGPIRLVVEYWKWKRIETPSISMRSITTFTWCTELFIRRISSVSTEQSQSGVESSPEIILVRQVGANLNKQEELQILGWYSETTASFGKIESLRTTAKFYHPVEEENYYVTIPLEDDGWGRRTSVCKEYTARRNQVTAKPHASIDANQDIAPVWNVGIARKVVPDYHETTRAFVSMNKGRGQSPHRHVQTADSTFWAGHPAKLVGHFTRQTGLVCPSILMRCTRFEITAPRNQNEPSRRKLCRKRDHFDYFRMPSMDASGPQNREDTPSKPNIVPKAKLTAHRGRAPQTAEASPRVDKKTLNERFGERIVELWCAHKSSSRMRLWRTVHSARALPDIEGRESRVDVVRVIPQEGAGQAGLVSAAIWSRAKIEQTPEGRLLILR